MARSTQAENVQRWVGTRVAERRREYGLTQEQLAERLEVSIKYLQRVEAGSENLTIESITTLANQLDTQPSYLLRPTRVKAKRIGRPRKPRRPKDAAATATATKAAGTPARRRTKR